MVINEPQKKIEFCHQRIFGKSQNPFFASSMLVVSAVEFDFIVIIVLINFSNTRRDAWETDSDNYLVGRGVPVADVYHASFFVSVWKSME